jgi:hypothetical protein
MDNNKFRRIDELYHERDVLTRWLIVATIFFFIPGVALGLAIQIKNVDSKIRKEIDWLKANDDNPDVIAYVIPTPQKAEEATK